MTDTATGTSTSDTNATSLLIPTRDQLELESLAVRSYKDSVDAERWAWHLEQDKAKVSGRVLNIVGGTGLNLLEYAEQAFRVWRYHSDAPITVQLTSPGGELFSGFALYDLIRQTISEGQIVNTHATGVAASMAGILLQAGVERSMTPNSFLMIHEASSITHGSLSVQEFRDQTEMLERLQVMAVSILASRSNVDEDYINEQTKRRDWWLTAEEALEFGFIDTVRTPAS